MPCGGRLEACPTTSRRHLAKAPENDQLRAVDLHLGHCKLIPPNTVDNQLPTGAWLESASGQQTPIRGTCVLGRANSSQVVLDRKSTRLNSSHSSISYAVFCLKK